MNKPPEYTFSGFTPRICGKCGDRHDVPFSVESYPMGNIVSDLEDEVQETMTGDGWKDGYCPECAFAHADELKARAQADDARKEMEEAL